MNSSILKYDSCLQFNIKVLLLFWSGPFRYFVCLLVVCVTSVPQQFFIFRPNLLKLQSFTKYLESSWRNPVKCDFRGKFNSWFCSISNAFTKFFALEGRLGTRLYLPLFLTFSKCPHFLRSLVLSRSSASEAT